MKLYKLFSLIIILFLASGLKSIMLAQSEPILYFCENFTNSGEVGISDIFTTGFITIVAKCDHNLGLTDCQIEYDKLDSTQNKFEFYKLFDFTVQSDLNYIYFTKNENSDLSFDEPGIYRVILLDNKNERVASSLIQIVSK